MAMNPEQHQLLTLAVLPARLNVAHTAHFLGFQSHELTALMAAGLLRPLGRPAANSPKYFAIVELEELRRDTKWLAKATDAVQNRWRQKNHTHPSPPAPGPRLNGGGQRPRPTRPPITAESALTPNL